MKNKNNKAVLIKEKNILKEMKKTGVDPCGIKIMLPKSIFRIIKLTNIRPALANIIKEDMLSAGGEAAVHKLSCACKVESTDVILMGTMAQYKHLLQDLSCQPYGGKQVCELIKKMFN